MKRLNTNREFKANRPDIAIKEKRRGLFALRHHSGTRRTRIDQKRTRRCGNGCQHAVENGRERGPARYYERKQGNQEAFELLMLTLLLKRAAEEEQFRLINL